MDMGLSFKGRPKRGDHAREVRKLRLRQVPPCGQKQSYRNANGGVFAAKLPASCLSPDSGATKPAEISAAVP
jgi:hypothetical protein